MNPVGITVATQTRNITTGDNVAPSNIPNLNHNLFGTIRAFGAAKARMNNTKESTKVTHLNSPSTNRDQILPIKKIIAKTMPKLGSEPNLSSTCDEISSVILS